MAKRQHETRPRPRSREFSPINPYRIAVGDGPPPEGFDPAQPPAGTGKPIPGPWRRYPEKRVPPALANGSAS